MPDTLPNTLMQHSQYLNPQPDSATALAQVSLHLLAVLGLFLLSSGSGVAACFVPETGGHTLRGLEHQAKGYCIVASYTGSGGCAMGVPVTDRKATGGHCSSLPQVSKSGLLKLS